VVDVIVFALEAAWPDPAAAAAPPFAAAAAAPSLASLASLCSLGSAALTTLTSQHLVTTQVATTGQQHVTGAGQQQTAAVVQLVHCALVVVALVDVVAAQVAADTTPVAENAATRASTNREMAIFFMIHLLYLTQGRAFTLSSVNILLILLKDQNLFPLHDIIEAKDGLVDVMCETQSNLVCMFDY